MGSRYFQRPENAISKADEFIKVGKPTRALDTLYDVIKSKKRNNNFSEKLIEQIMFKYLELCVDLKKSHVAKEGLFQYRNMCQTTNVASLAAVVQGYLSMAEKRTDSARQESVESVQDVDDLDNLATPEMILLSAVSGEDAQDRSDRKILMPWVKFLWESYCQCLELLRTNVRVERLYHDIAQQAFRFCLKYQRKTEFRKLCDKLRNHLDLVLKQTPSPVTINLSNADTQQMNLDTKLCQLDAAIQMELWQEAYKAVEDIHGLMTLSKKVFQPKMMANYYQKLALVFWKCGNYLFHAAAIFKHFQLTREMKKNISAEELGKMASRVLAAILAVPIPSHHPEFDKFIETDRTPQEKMARLAVLLSLQQPPTRQSLIKDAARFGIVQAATQPLQDLYQWLEVDFHPLKLCDRVQTTLKFVESSDDMTLLQQYLPALREITLVRLLKQVAQVYQSICFDRLLHLAPFADAFTLERVIVDCVRHNDMQVRIDHRTKTVHFGTDLAEAQSHDQAEGPHLQDMPSEQVRTQLMFMLEVLDKSLKTIHPDKVKIENNDLRKRIVEAYHSSKARDHQRILARHKMIEERKEYLEKLNIHREAEEARKAEQQLREQQKLEEERLEAERKERDRIRQEEKLREIKKRHIEETLKNIAQTEIGQKVLAGMDETEIADLDTDKIMMKQVEELENEKRQLVAKLKAQEKRVDHLERAKRKEEIPLLMEAIKQDEEEDKVIWKSKEEDRIKQSIVDREIAVKTRDRLSRMKEDKDAFMNSLLKQRKATFESKLKDFNKMIEEERVIRLAERKKKRKDEKRAKWIRDKQEEEQRKRDEELKRQREEQARLEEERRLKEEEEYRKRKEALDIAAAKQAEREKEMERKLQEERVENMKKKEAAARSEEPRGGREREREDNWRKEPEGGWRARGAAAEPGPEREERGERGDRGEQPPKSAWRPGVGSWRDREKQKSDEWGPSRRDERDDRPQRGPVRRDDDRRDDKVPARRDDPPVRRDDAPVRRDDERGPRRTDDERVRRDDDDRGPGRDDRRPPARRDEDDWRRGPAREDRGPARDGPPPVKREERRDDRRDDKRDDRRDDRRGGEGGGRRGGFDDNWRSGGGSGPARGAGAGGPRRDDRGPPRRTEDDDGANWRRAPAREERGPAREHHDERAPPAREGPRRAEEGQGQVDDGWTTVKRS